MAKQSVANCIAGLPTTQPPTRGHHPPPGQEANDESFLEAAHWLQDDRRQDDQSPIKSRLVRTITAVRRAKGTASRTSAGDPKPIVNLLDILLCQRLLYYSSLVVSHMPKPSPQNIGDMKH
uniref:GH27691p n=1 Tax=Drosophila melanogaster TaxID=7227 RepID=Q9VJG7_DROME